jgi:lipoprotein-anchoring transpeptidase ErfK/SrfK
MPCSELAVVLKREMSERLAGLGLPVAEDCIVVSIDQQKLWILSKEALSTFVISTARAGVGCIQDSLQTPYGLHRVSEKIGSGADAGMVFKARKATGVHWQDWPTPEDNLITSRILWLEGMEAGVNAGTNAAGQVVDTKARYVYLHGTNQVAKLGQPNSHGCILLSDADIINIFEIIPVGTPVLIRA